MVPPEDLPRLTHELLELRCNQLWGRIRNCTYISNEVSNKIGWWRHDMIEAAISQAGFIVLQMMREGRINCLKEYFLTGDLTESNWYQLINYAKAVASRFAGHELKRLTKLPTEPLEYHAELTKGTVKDARNDFIDSLGIKFFTLAFRILKIAKQKRQALDYRAFLNRINGWEFEEIAEGFRTRSGRPDRNKAARSVTQSTELLGKELGRLLPIEFLQKYCSINQLTMKLIDSTGKILVDEVEKVGVLILRDLVRHFNVCRRVQFQLLNPNYPLIIGKYL